MAKRAFSLGIVLGLAVLVSGSALASECAYVKVGDSDCSLPKGSKACPGSNMELDSGGTCHCALTLSQGPMKVMVPTAWCPSGCVNTTWDPKNCGSCGNDCGTGTCNNGTCQNLQSDNNNCGATGNVCGHNTYCYKGSCAHTPERYGFCPGEWCQATCNDGWVVRDLCTPCSDKCNSSCQDHGGCKETCTRAGARTFNAECAPNLEH